MTTFFKNPRQTTRVERPAYEPLPLVSSEGEALRQKSGPRSAKVLSIADARRSTNKENNRG
jgi:hypothetical protein